MKRLPILLSILLGTSCIEGLAAPTFTPDSQPVGWLARPALSSTDISSGNEAVFLFDYVEGPWSGDVVARGVDAEAFPTDTYRWAPATAASKLDELNWNTGRKIAAGYKGAGVAFRWDSLRDVQGQFGADGAKVLEYVRGDRDEEEPDGKKWRAREHVLGDILHSTVAYWKHDDGTGRIYVGANDGMLHAFDAATGAEVFAYVPSMAIPSLRKLVNKSYVHSHYVDSGIAIGKVDIVGGTNKTILVGSLGAGGRGIYALDITTPTAGSEAAAAGKVLWEISATGDFANLGFTYGTPRRAILEDGTAVVIFGNGYMNSGDKRAVLFIVNVLTGALVRAIDTGSGTAASPNGLSTPTLVDVDGNGKVERVYAGDLDGQLWRFDLNNNTAAKVYTTTPAQAITSPPAVSRHPLGGYMVLFGTGRTLTTGDLSDNAVHAVYGIWDGAPAANQTLLAQTLSDAMYEAEEVRTVTRNLPDWTRHRGWKLELPAGERVTGEEPFEKNGRFYFVSTNPTVPYGEGWLHELVVTTGGSPATPIFDLNADGFVNATDLATDCTPDTGAGRTCVPIAQFLGPGVFSQPIYVAGKGFGTTFYTYHTDSVSGDVADPLDPGVSGGHFDFDLYHWGSETVTEQILVSDLDPKTQNLCVKNAQVALEYNKVSPTFCTVANGFPAGYGFMTGDGSPGACCANCAKNKKGQYTSRDVKFLRDITCNAYEIVKGATGNQYAKILHVHEYDDKYGVTGVNMLNASDPKFNLSNAIKDDTTKFKVLLMNQYLNPAATLSVGGAKYESVKTYKGLASATNATTLLAGLPIYTRATVGTLIYNLPLDAFKSKDWWGDGKPVRAGLIPTQTGCVNKVNADGSMTNNGANGMIGPNGERFDGALTIQLIRDTTPATALEFNHNGNGNLSDGERAAYGWRVKQAEFSKWVLAEYTSFWHHPNHFCYGQQAWTADPPEDPSDATPGARPAGTADPTDGVFTGGATVKNVQRVVSLDGKTTTTTTTYNNVNGAYVKTEVTNADGTVTVTQTFLDGTQVVTTISGEASLTGLGRTSNEALGGLATGRQSWRELVD